MTRAEVLKLRTEILQAPRKPKRYRSDTAVVSIIDCYESLLSRCVPWLEAHYNEVKAGYVHVRDRELTLAQLDALLNELREVKP